VSPGLTDQSPDDHNGRMIWLLLIAGAYLVGSIPFGVLIARSQGVDIRQHGSKNIGATNVGRVLGRRFGLTCFALDACKGALPVVAAGFVADVIGRSAVDLSHTQMWLWLTVAIAAVAGHMFSIFLRFAGGKGVATAAGALLGMWPLLTIPVLAALVVWIVVVKIWRYVALASMCAAVSVPIAVPIVAMLGSDPSEEVAARVPLLIVTLALAVLVILRHRSNIARLMRGEEPKIGAKRSEADASE